MPRMDIIGTRVSPDTKARFRALAHHETISESALLRRVIDAALLQSATLASSVVAPNRHARGCRFSVRVTPDDQALLEARAQARGMRAATYASVLVRAHLRSLAPLPTAELRALKRSVAELGAIGRNLNQIARHLNQGAPSMHFGREDLFGMLRVCEGLRDHTKHLIRANIESWDQGYASPTTR